MATMRAWWSWRCARPSGWCARNTSSSPRREHGLVCANSGVDVSNVDGGKTAVLLPADADRSAAQIHRKLKKRTGLHIPVIIADSFGRPWREGLCEVAIGVAGMKVIHDYRGKRDLMDTKCMPRKKPWPTNWRALRGWCAAKIRAFRLV